MLYGAVNPSGRLPYTIAKSPSDYSAQLVTGGGPNDILSIPYSEGLNIDYRHFDSVSPLYASHSPQYLTDELGNEYKYECECISRRRTSNPDSNSASG